MDHRKLRAAVRAQADSQGESGWMDLVVEGLGTLKVPRGAFEMAAVARCGGGHLATPWTPVAPAGLKQRGDDRFHTDWMLGAGLPLNAMMPYCGFARFRELRKAAEDAQAMIQERLLGFKAMVLLPGPNNQPAVVMGQAHMPSSPRDWPTVISEDEVVLVLRHASADYVDMARRILLDGGAVVVENGGELTHLVNVLREEGRGPIVRVPDALRKYPPGSFLQVCTYTGSVTLKDRPYSPFLNVGDPFGDGRRYTRHPEDDVPPPAEFTATAAYGISYDLVDPSDTVGSLMDKPGVASDSKPDNEP